MRRGTLVALVLIACRSPAAVSTSPPVTVAAVDGGALTVVPEAAAPARAMIDLDLLHWTRAVVNVSSNVDNPRDYPEHLVDGRADTAWNGRTGDLGYIEFQVPNDATVRQIELSAGYDKKTPAGDYFAMNLRIKKVKVTRTSPRPEIRIGEFTLDPEQRLPQPIPVGQSGGQFRIEVLETVPGTKKTWNEVVVSELHVMGDPGGSKTARWRMPNVVVGSQAWTSNDGDVDAADPVDAKLLESRTAGSAEELCQAYVKAAMPVLKEQFPEDRYPGPPASPYCTIGRPLWPAFKPSGGVRGLRELIIATPSGLEHHLAIELEGGDVVMPRAGALAREKQWVDGATQESAQVKSVRVDDKTLVVAVTHLMSHERYCMDSQTVGLEITTELEMRCPLDVKPMACTRIDRRRSCRGFSCSSLFDPY